LGGAGQPRGDCPYLNSTNHLDALYLGLLYYRQDLGRNRVFSPKYFVQTLNLGKKTRFLKKI
jgi:hypothetical protein